MRLNPALFLHPDDKAIQQELNSSFLFRLLLWGYEKVVLPENELVASLSANGYRISEDIHPDVYHDLLDICRKLEIPVPEIYVHHWIDDTVYAVYPEHSYLILSPNILFLRPARCIKSSIALACAEALLNPFGNWMIVANLTSFLIGKVDKIAIKLLTTILDRSLRRGIYASCLSADRIAMMYFEGDEEMVENCFSQAGNWNNQPVPEETLAFREETAQYHQLYEKYIDDHGIRQVKLDKLGLINITMPGPKKRASEIIQWKDTEEFRKLNLCMNHPEQAQEWPIPFDCDAAKGQPAEKIRDTLSLGGFTNITTEVSWKKDPHIPDGSVSCMTVDGTTSCQQGEWFPADVPIVLTIQQRPPRPENN